MPNPVICYLNEQFLPYDEAGIHVSDLALHRGYGVFEFLREIDGRVPFLDDYLDRFFRSASGLGLKVPVGNQQLKEIIHHLLKEISLKIQGSRLSLQGVIRMIFTIRLNQTLS